MEEDHPKRVYEEISLIKAIMKDEDDRKILLLGISKENVNRLREGKPLNIKGKELGLDNDVVIIYGETEAHLYKDLQPFLGPETRVEPMKPQTL